jgi:hypothetical protein
MYYTISVEWQGDELEGIWKEAIVFEITASHSYLLQ